MRAWILTVLLAIFSKLHLFLFSFHHEPWFRCLRLNWNKATNRERTASNNLRKQWIYAVEIFRNFTKPIGKEHRLQQSISKNYKKGGMGNTKIYIEVKWLIRESTNFYENWIACSATTDLYEKLEYFFSIFHVFSFFFFFCWTWMYFFFNFSQEIIIHHSS